MSSNYAASDTPIPSPLSGVCGLPPNRPSPKAKQQNLQQTHPEIRPPSSCRYGHAAARKHGTHRCGPAGLKKIKTQPRAYPAAEDEAAQEVAQVAVGAGATVHFHLHLQPSLFTPGCPAVAITIRGDGWNASPTIHEIFLGLRKLSSSFSSSHKLDWSPLLVPPLRSPRSLWLGDYGQELVEGLKKEGIKPPQQEPPPEPAQPEQPKE